VFRAAIIGAREVDLTRLMEEARNGILTSSYDRSVTACRRVLAKHPKHIEATCLLGEAYREQGHRQQAEDLFRRVLSADPENILANWALGLILRDSHRDREAADFFACAHELAPGNPELLADLLSVTKDRLATLKTNRAQLGRWYAAAGLYERAAEEYEAALSATPKRLDLWVALAEALWRSGDDLDAEEVCESILADSPDCLKALIILADVRARVQSDVAHGDRLRALARELDPADAIIARMN
jgi:cytochrome c-type biogenesis protein CcmH/NrfG